MEQTQCKLIDICNIQYGYAFDSKKFTDNSNNIALIRIRDVKAGKSYTYYSGDYDNTYIVNTGDILIGMDGEFNIAKWKSKPALLNQRVCKLIPSEKINSDYLLYYLSVELKKIETKTAFVTVKHLSAKELNSLKLEVPNLQMQEKIAQRLIYVQKLIELGQKQIDSYNILIKSRFVEMFGTLQDNQYRYDIVTIEDVCLMVKDGTHQTPTYTENTEEGYKFLSSKDVMTQKIDWSDIKYIPADLHEKLYATIKPQRNDILMSKNGVNYGVAAVNDTDEIFDIYVSLALLRPKKIINPVYFRCVINNLDTKRQFDGSIKGIGVPNLHLGEIKKTKILLPSIALQEQFATFVQQVDKLKVEEQQRLEKAQMLFDSLMQQYFG